MLQQREVHCTIEFTVSFDLHIVLFGQIKNRSGIKLLKVECEELLCTNDVKSTLSHVLQATSSNLIEMIFRVLYHPLTLTEAFSDGCFAVPLKLFQKGPRLLYFSTLSSTTQERHHPTPCLALQKYESASPLQIPHTSKLLLPRHVYSFRGRFCFLRLRLRYFLQLFFSALEPTFLLW